MDAWIGQIVGKYRILDWIGQGGMATVYKAWDLERQRLVAFKALFPFLTNDPSFRARFEREAKILHHLRHPNIIPVLDFGEAEGLLYLVMPYITLGSLRDRLDVGPVTVEQGSKIIRQIASALQFAHNRRVIHRDVKPSNILIDDNFNAWLSDFGFARMHDASMSITGSSLVGTPAYMSPEQILGHSTTPSSDQYALGVMLYQLATGHLPYEAETPMGLALKHATEPLPRPRAVNPKLPDAVEQVIVRALSKDGNFRYPSVTAFSDAFQAALYQIYDAHSGKLKSGSIGPPPSQILQPVRDALSSLTMPVVKTMQHRRALPWVAALLLLLLPVTALAFTLFNQPGSTAVAQVIESTPQESAIQRTLVVLQENVAGRLGDDRSENVVETAVAATMSAFQDTESTPTVFGGGGVFEPTGSPTSRFTTARPTMSSRWGNQSVSPRSCTGWAGQNPGSSSSSTRAGPTIPSPSRGASLELGPFSAGCSRARSLPGADRSRALPIP